MPALLTRTSIRPSSRSRAPRRRGGAPPRSGSRGRRRRTLRRRRPLGCSRGSERHGRRLARRALPARPRGQDRPRSLDRCCSSPPSRGRSCPASARSWVSMLPLVSPDRQRPSAMELDRLALGRGAGPRRCRLRERPQHLSRGRRRRRTDEAHPSETGRPGSASQTTPLVRATDDGRTAVAAPAATSASASAALATSMPACAVTGAWCSRPFRASSSGTPGAGCTGRARQAVPP